MSRTFQRLVTLGTALLVSLALALPAFASTPPPPPSTNMTNQIAANTAYVTITAVAVSGDATSKDEGKAESGDANVFIANEQEQLNVQAVVSGVIGACGCQTEHDAYGPNSHEQQSCGCPATAVDNATQTADNYAQATLEGTASSGNATATEEECDEVAVGSMIDGRNHEKTEAESGDATVKIVSEQEQANLQLALNLAIPTIEKHERDGKVEAASTEQKGATADNFSNQSAANTAYANLSGTALSGNAVAEGKHAKAESGEAEVFIFSEQEQLNAQAIVNLAFPWSSTNNSAQKAEGNYLQAGIDGTALSGNAKNAESGEAEVIVPNEQEQANLQLVLTFNGVKVKCY